MNVFFSLLAIYFIYKIAEELYDNSGILAAILAAVFPSYNVWSGCVLSDTALAAVAIYYAIKYMKERKKKYLIITTVMCAVSTTQKYTALLTCTLVVALVVCDQSYQIKKLSTFLWCCVKEGFEMILIYILAFIISAPNVVTNFGRTIQIIISEGRPYHQGADGLGFFGNIQFYSDVYWTQMELFSGWL